MVLAFHRLEQVLGRNNHRVAEGYNCPLAVCTNPAAEMEGVLLDQDQAVVSG